MPPRRCPKSWAASLLALVIVAAPSRLLRTTAGAITTPAAAQSKEKIKPTTRNYKTDGGWRPSAGGAAGAVAFGAFLSCSAPSTSGSSAARARVLGALLAFSPHLAAARKLPFGPANTSVATRRKLGYVMTDSNIETAVAAWLADASAAEATYGHISGWDTSQVTSMQTLFCFRPEYWSETTNLWCEGPASAASFNEDITAWDTSGVTTMIYMFYNAASFNQDIGSWQVDKVQFMYGTFFHASAFNGPLGDWSVDNVQNMDLMFADASSFNQDISDWAVNSATTSMDRMFSGASAFNQDIGAWDTSGVRNMRLMFASASVLTRTVNGTGHTGTSEFCATSI